VTLGIQIFSSSTQFVHRIDTAIGHARPVLTMPSGSRAAKRSLRIGNLEIRTAELQVLVDGKRAGLTVREFELFLLLAERLDSVVQRPEIYELMWGGEMPRRDRSVDVLVRKVRRKLELVAPDWRYIHTHFGVGYRFSPEQG
jgi:DNA-binding response OmpR family regulator